MQESSMGTSRNVGHRLSSHGEIEGSSATTRSDLKDCDDGVDRT